MRQIQKGLGCALEPFDTDFVEQQRQDDRHRETEDQIQNVEQQRVEHGFAEVTVGENFLKDLKPHKLTAGVAARNLVIKEGDGQTAVGKVLENDDEEHREYHQDVQLPIALQVEAGPLFADGQVVSGRFGFGWRHAISSCSCFVWRGAVCPFLQAGRKITTNAPLPSKFIMHIHHGRVFAKMHEKCAISIIYKIKKSSKNLCISFNSPSLLTV